MRIPDSELPLGAASVYCIQVGLTFSVVTVCRDVLKRQAFASDVEPAIHSRGNGLSEVSKALNLGINLKHGGDGRLRFQGKDR